MSELAVIINSFNRKELLGYALSSLITSLEHLSHSSAVIVFEAGSTDGSKELLEELKIQDGKVQIHCIMPDDPGRNTFSDGCNQAFAYAISTFKDLQWCFLYETDNFLKNVDALPAAIQFLEQQSTCGAVGFTVERLDGSKTGYGCSFPKSLGFVIGQQLSERFQLDADSDSPWQSTPTAQRWRKCQTVFTSPLLVRAQTWQETSGMDCATFPFTDSDLDWCKRAQDKGWDIAVIDVKGVVHDNRQLLSAWSGKRVLWFHQGRLRYFLKHKPYIAQIIKPLLFIRHLAELSILAFRSPFSKDWRSSMNTRFKLLRTVFNNYN